MAKNSVYIAGPYSDNNIIGMRNAIHAGNRIMELGYVPFVPHLTGFWDFYSSKPKHIWMKYDLHWLEKCDAVYRISGNSEGADIEVNHARLCNIPVFTSITNLANYFNHLDSKGDYIDAEALWNDEASEASELQLGELTKDLEREN